MKHILSLIIFLPTFLIFAQADTHDRLSARSSALDKASSNLFVKRKKKEHPMTCNVSRYVRQTGYPLDCYCAIEFLYSSSFPACVICRSCLVQPLDGNERPYGGQRDKDGQPIAPALGQTTMNSAYDAALSGEGYGGKPLCDGYSLPPNVELDPNYHYTPGLIFPTFLLGLKVGQPEVAMECTPELAKKAFKEAM